MTSYDNWKTTNPEDEFLGPEPEEIMENTMADKIDVELFISMNESGDWVVTADEDEALGLLAEQQGGSLARVVKITVKMAPPQMAEAEVTVHDEAGIIAAQSEAA